MASLTQPPSRPRTLGPVADLEKHLPPDWWRTLFNAVYLKTDGDVVENDQNTIKEVDILIQATGITPDQHILDLCCGQGRHTLELYHRGFENVTGLDRSRYLLRMARKRAQQLNYNIRFSEGDARKIRHGESSFDCVVLFGNSFGYFDTQEDDYAVLRSIVRVLKSQGKLAMDLMNGEWMRQNFERRSWEWIDENHFVCRERELSEDQSRIISREVVVHAERGVIADQFYAERLYTFADIKAILQELDFTDIQQYAELNPHSDRDQDLGMMAHRIFISARSPEKKPFTPSKSTQQPILVLLGDPRVADPIKRDGQFNAEDFATIEKLKAALAPLNYQFSYFDHHKKLIDFLRNNKPSFVLNLCDEGYGNNAKHELHVPALLEMFAIPYSGAAPACLALCYNKSSVRAIAQSLDIPVPLETYYNPSDHAATLPSIFPSLLKPNFGDSSMGITQHAVVNNPQELVNYLNELKLHFPDTPILIQEYLPGAEYSVGLIGNPGNFTALPILMVDYSGLPETLPQLLCYESKWLPDSPYWDKIRYVPSTLDVELERRLIDDSMLLFERLDCRDYARFDFRADESGQIKLLEVNPNPGWCWDGKLNLMASFSGKHYSDLLAMIIDAAMDRLNQKN